MTKRNRLKCLLVLKFSLTGSLNSCYFRFDNFSAFQSCAAVEIVKLCLQNEAEDFFLCRVQLVKLHFKANVETIRRVNLFSFYIIFDIDVFRCNRIIEKMIRPKAYETLSVY